MYNEQSQLLRQRTRPWIIIWARGQPTQILHGQKPMYSRPKIWPIIPDDHTQLFTQSSAQLT